MARITALTIVVVGVVVTAGVDKAAAAMGPVADTSTVCKPVFPGYHMISDQDATFYGCYINPSNTHIFPAGAMEDLWYAIDKDSWETLGNAKEIIQDCGYVAYEKGATYFGLKNYGECFYGDSPDLSATKVTKSDGCSRFCKWDVGGPNGMVVYKLGARAVQTACLTQHVGYSIDETHWAKNLGCYHNADSSTNGRGGTVFLASSKVNLRHQSDFPTWNKHEHAGDMVQKCGKLAIEKRRKFFGVGDYENCYFGKKPDYSSGEITPADDCDRKCRWDVGGPGAIVVYELNSEW